MQRLHAEAPGVTGAGAGVSCLFCDETFANVQMLADHLLQRHAEAVSVGGHLLDRTANMVGCFCGSWFRDKARPLEQSWEMWPLDENTPTFAEHLAERGGLAAHVLEIAMLPWKGRR